MTPPLPTNAAGEPIDPSRDLVGVAFRGMAVAVLSGAAMVAGVLWGVQALLLGRPETSEPVSSGPAPALLLAGTLGAMIVAGAVAWRRLAPITSYFRRGILSLICALATFVAALIAAPIHYAAGGLGLVVMAAVATAGAVVLARRGENAAR